MLRLSILIYGIYLIKNITGYRQGVSFPSWGEKKTSEFAMTTGMDCKTFIKRYICTGQVLRNVTSYKQVNVCCPGYITENGKCVRACGDGRFGYNCSSRCVCNPENTSLCDPVSGDCNCKPGWSGITCNMVCPHGQFGEGCATKCDCNSSDACDPFSGRCIEKLSAEDLEDPEEVAEEERRTFVIVAISCVSGIVLAIGLVFTFIFCKDRFKRTSSHTRVEADEDVILDDRHTKETKLYYDSIPVNAIINQPGSSLSGSTTELIAAQSEIDTRDIMAPHVYHVLEKNGTSFDSLHRKNRLGITNNTFAGTSDSNEETDSMSNHYHVLNPYTTVAEVNGTQTRDFEYPAALSAQSLNVHSESYYKSIDEMDCFTDSSFESEDEFDMRTFIRKDKAPPQIPDNEYSVINKTPQKEMNSFRCEPDGEEERENTNDTNVNGENIIENEQSPCFSQNPDTDHTETTFSESKVVFTMAPPVEPDYDCNDTEHIIKSEQSPPQTDSYKANTSIYTINNISKFQDGSLPSDEGYASVVPPVAEKSIGHSELLSETDKTESVPNWKDLALDGQLPVHSITDSLRNTPQSSTISDEDEARDNIDDICDTSSSKATENTRRVSTLSEQFTVISELLQKAIDETKHSDDKDTTNVEEWKATMSPRRIQTCTYSKDIEVVKYRTVFTCCSGYMDTGNVSYCDKGCEIGMWGMSCDQSCGCPANAFTECNMYTGECTCQAGWIGDNCDQHCNAGYFGQGCDMICLCENNSTCESILGTCDCSSSPGWKGVYCNEGK
ncbi:hypothetical protein FSP39_020698 [Pinctada imbricata]|uniref:Uncharacterized protein n=1 Tax=Pinctada imbricata TaxID=66713 RepID=A0AA88YED4_PINIB|nr:hypothetical protein FSP39_020698 [Pinctada imbricata]